MVRHVLLQKKLNAELAIVDKRRDKPGESEVIHLIGDVQGRLVILIDDIVDSRGTICHAAKALKEAGAAQVFAYGTHGVLSGDANERIQKSELQSLTLTNSISLRMTDPIPHIYTLSIAYF